MAKDISIRCNGATVYFDFAQFKRGVAKISEGTMSEQCEGCGDDLTNSASADVRADAIKCDCGETYQVRRAS